MRQQRQRRLLEFVALCLAVLFGGALSAQFTVTGVAPNRHANAGAKSGEITASFNQNMSVANLTASGFSVRRTLSPAFRFGSYQVGPVPTDAIYTPAAPLFPGELVEVSLTSALRSASNAALAQPHVWHYRAAAGPGPGAFDWAIGEFGTGQTLTAVAVGDIDGDGDIDIIGVQNGGQNTVWLNDGGTPPTFTSTVMFGTGLDATSSVALGDMNGDGSLDIIIGNVAEQNLVYLNDGASPPAFPSTIAFGTGTDSTRIVRVVDMNGDGDLDIVAANSSSQSDAIYLFSGGAVATTLPFGGNTNSLAMAYGDVDGDGDIDVVTANPFAPVIRLFTNDGSGALTFAANVGNAEKSYDLAIGDLDGDGLPDLVVTDIGAVGSQNAVYFGNGGQGAPSFSGVGLPFGPTQRETRAVALVDVDGDGRLDIATANEGAPAGASTIPKGAQNSIYTWDAGSGGFLEISRFGFEVDASMALAVGDLNGDGELDLIVSNGEQVNGLLHGGAFFLNDAGRFDGMKSWSSQPLGIPVLGDFDGDGDLDILVVASDASVIPHYNDGKGVFTAGAIQSFGPNISNAYSVTTGDIDSDGDLDLIIGYSQLTGTAVPFGLLLKNDGAGAFTLAADIGAPGNRLVNDLALGDVNGDGYPDLVIAPFVGEIYLFLNNGSGFPGNGSALFQASAGPTNSIVFSDVDNDGNLDLLSQENDKVLIRFNDGAGNFTGAIPDELKDAGQSRIQVGDLDGDGLVDIFTPSGGVFYNKGTANLFPISLAHGGQAWYGMFAPVIPTGASGASSAVFFDGDGDGDLDIALASNSVSSTKLYPHRYLENLGGRQFAAAREFGSRKGGGIAAGDIDGDGDIDIIDSRGLISFNTIGKGAFAITSSASLGTAVEGALFSTTFTASGGTAPLQWSASAGKPMWLTLNATTGMLSGTPPIGAAGTQTFSITVADSATPPRSASLTVAVTIVPGSAVGALTIVTASFPTAVEAVPYAAVISVSGGVTPYSWSAVGLPAWLLLDSATGALSGTPPSGSAGIVGFSVTVNDGATPAASAARSYSLFINGPGGISATNALKLGGGGGCALNIPAIGFSMIAAFLLVCLSARLFRPAQRHDRAARA